MQAEEKRRWRWENQQEELEKVQYVADVDNVVGEGQFEDPIQILVWCSQDILGEKLDLTTSGFMFVYLCVCVFICLCVRVCPCVDLQAALPAVLHHQTGVGWFRADTKELDQVLVFHLLHLFLEQDSATQRHQFTQV